MKKFLVTTMMFMMASASWAQTEVNSKIEQVQVYLQGAEIHRTASLDLKSGRNEIKLHKLSALLDPNTIQVSGSGFTILSVRHEKDYIKTGNLPARVDALQREKSRLQDSIKRLDLSLAIIKKEMVLLDKNSGIVGTEGINNDDFQKAMTYFTNRYGKLSKDQFDLKIQKTELVDKITILDRQITSESAQKEEASSNIILTLNTATALQANITIQYTIKEAGWFPAYDIRAINTDSPLAISFKARVYQNSGIDWKDVKLRISSGNIESNGTVPELSPYFLVGYVAPAPYNGPVNQVSGRVVDETGLPLPRVTVLVKGTTIGTPTDANGYYSLQIPSDKSTLIFRFLGYTTQEIPANRPNISISMDPEVEHSAEVVVTGYGSTSRKLRGKATGVQTRRNASQNRSMVEAKSPLQYEQINYQTSFVYDIELPYSIPSTGKPEVVEIKTENLEADYEYITVPKAREEAYLVARIADWEKLNLLDGESNLYFQNSFIGQSLIDTSIGNDTLEVSLGKDEAIIVNRERKRDFEEQRFLSGKKREQRHFEITVMNTKNSAVDLVLYDQIPIAVRDNIKVSVNETTNGERNSETGLITWKLNLKPGEKKVLQLKYTVDHPKSGDLVVN